MFSVGWFDDGAADIYQLFSGLTPGAQYKVRYAQAQRGDVPSVPSVLNVQWKYWEGGVYGGTNQILYQQTTTETAATYRNSSFVIRSDRLPCAMSKSNISRICSLYHIERSYCGN